MLIQDVTGYREMAFQVYMSKEEFQEGTFKMKPEGQTELGWRTEREVRAD